MVEQGVTLFCWMSCQDSEESVLNVAIGNAMLRSMCWTGAGAWTGAGKQWCACCCATVFMPAPFICSQTGILLFKSAEHPRIHDYFGRSCTVCGWEVGILSSCCLLWQVMVAVGVAARLCKQRVHLPTILLVPKEPLPSISSRECHFSLLPAFLAATD